MILQVANVGINRFIKKHYCREYTASLCASSVTNKLFDDTVRIESVVRTVLALKNKTHLIADCFAKTGLQSGYREVHAHFPPAVFSTGVCLRDCNLPFVDLSYVFSVLSMENLASAPGSPVKVPESLLYDRKRMLSEFIAADNGFRKFYLALGLSAIVYSEYTDVGKEKGGTITTGVCKLFKFGDARNLRRRAPGRLSTAYGSLASARDKWRACAEKEQRQEAKPEA